MPTQTVHPTAQKSGTRYWMLAFIGGLSGTFLMTLSMYQGYSIGLPRLDNARLFGSLWRSGEEAFWIGMAWRHTNGVLFALLYGWWARKAGRAGLTSGLFLGGLLWLISMAVLMPSLSLIHPLIRSGEIPPPGFFLQHQGPLAAFHSLLVHLLYGGVVGLFLKWGRARE